MKAMNMRAEQVTEYSKLGIIAGQGRLPGQLIEAANAQEREIFVLAFEGETDPKILTDEIPHAFIQHGAVGKAIELLEQHKVRQIVAAGRIERPSLTSIRPDAKGAKLLARLGKSLLAGDDKLLSTITQFLEEEGFEMIGVEEVLEDILTPEGLIGNQYPDKLAQEDIALGVRVAKTLGALDIGQAVIVQRGYVLGVEALEGTDQLIERCKQLKMAETGGVLVKACKPGQEKRMDLPSIGVDTIQHMVEAGFAGIALEAGQSLMIDKLHVIREANKHGLFLVGFTDDNASE